MLTPPPPTSSTWDAALGLSAREAELLALESKEHAMLMLLANVDTARTSISYRKVWWRK